MIDYEGFRLWALRRRSKNTVNQYIRRLQNFEMWLVENGLDLTPEAVDRYLTYLTSKGLDTNTIFIYYSTIRQYFKYLGAEKELDTKVEPPRFETAKYYENFTVITPQELSIIPKIKNLRDRALLMFLADTGRRRSEISEMNREDVDLEKGIYTVKAAKRRGKPRTLVRPFRDPRTVEYLKAYLYTRDDDNPALFLSNRGKRISPEEIYYIVRKYFGKSPKAFRHTVASQIVTSTGNLKLAAEYLAVTHHTAERYSHLITDIKSKLPKVL